MLIFSYSKKKKSVGEKVALQKNENFSVRKKNEKLENFSFEKQNHGNCFIESVQFVSSFFFY